MDEPSNSKFEVKWEIKVGDIVKIMRYDYNAYSVPAYGVVVKKEKNKKDNKKKSKNKEKKKSKKEKKKSKKEKKKKN